MGLFSSLYTGAAGMQAQTNATTTVSNNIANATTTGFKKSTTAFHDLVLSQSSNSAKEFRGAVTTQRILRADVQGTILNTSSGTDAAVIGNGFFPVKTNTDASTPFVYTRNGSFSENAEGILTNSAGFALFAWQLDETGSLPGNLNDASSLVPVDLDLFETQALPTSSIQLSMNLNAGETTLDPHVLGQELPVTNQNAQFSRSVTVFDSQGTARDVTFEFRKIVGPMAHFTSDQSSALTATSSLVGVNSSTPNIIAGDVLQISDGTNTLNITFANAPADTSLNEAATMEDVTTIIRNFAPGGTPVFDPEITADGRFLVRAVDPSATLDISGSSANVTGVGGFNFITDPGDNDLIYDPEADILADGTANPNQTQFPAFADATTPNTRFWWEVTVTGPDPANPTTGTTEIAKGLINFDGDGTLNATPDANGDITLDLGTVNFDNADTADDTAITVDITKFSQFTSPTTVITASQNGAGLGLLDRVEINNLGNVIGKFTNGQQSTLYKIPLVLFNNENGLQDLSGTVFSETGASGTPTFAEAGTGGAGTFSPTSLENSNVDIAAEFGTLIVSQRGFSANSQVFQTADEMAQLLSRLK